MTQQRSSLRIAVSGHSGCGNTTATQNVGMALGLSIVNYTFRDLALALGMSFEDLHHQASHHSIFDYLTDLIIMRKALFGENIVVGSRLAAWLMDADLHIWLHAPIESRSSRILAREQKTNSVLSYEQVLYKTMRRDDQNKQRYLRLYGLDIDDHSDFDMTINTDKLTAAQVSSLVVAAAQWAQGNQLERRNVHLPRIQTIIAKNLQMSVSDMIDPHYRIDVQEIYNRVTALGNY